VGGKTAKTRETGHGQQKIILVNSVELGAGRD